MIVFAPFESPFGTMAVARSKQGVCHLLFPETALFHEYLVAHYPRLTITKDRARTTDVIDQLVEYFAGRRKAFDLELDLNVPPFYRKVLLEVMRIPYGKTASYKEVALRVGNATAVRAVGGANASNPIPIIIPCHRVIAQNGSFGGYGGGLDLKLSLLALEKAL